MSAVQSVGPQALPALQEQVEQIIAEAKRQGASACEEVQDAGALDRVVVAAVQQEIEDRLAHAVRGGAQMCRLIALADFCELQASPLPSDDAHYFNKALRSGAEAI